MEKLHVVKYSGPFGFIKPWTAVRDEETFTQQFLTESILMGIERKLFPELLNEAPVIHKISRHRLSYHAVDMQQEQVQPRGWNKKGRKNNAHYERPYAILVRGVMINPVLWLAFTNEIDALSAEKQHICLSRNEDILLPTERVEVTRDEFEDESVFPGFELIIGEGKDSFITGINRFRNNEQTQGSLKIFGTPVSVEN